MFEQLIRRIGLGSLPRNGDHSVGRACLLCLALVTWAGCGSGLSSVSGQLTLDGQPLARSEQVQITIMFYPESGSGAPAAGIVDESGRYRLSTGRQDGIAPGEYVVTLAAVEVKPSAPGRPANKRVITPLRYTNPKLSDLRAAVQPGRNTLDFDLRSDAKGRS
jgi:hypothetical protein